MRLRDQALFAAVVATALACPGVPPENPQDDELLDGADAGVLLDAGVADAGEQDTDAGIGDAGAVDAGTACPPGFDTEASGRCARWQATAPMSVYRLTPTLVLLADGRALALGGEEPDGAVLRSSKVVEVFEGATLSWGVQEPMLQERLEPAAAQLDDGRVLVVGGMRKTAAPFSATQQVSAELFDPEAGAWTLGPAPSAPHTNGTATKLLDGRVLLVGGLPAGVSGLGFDPADTVAEVFDPVLGSWTQMAPLPEPRLGHTAALLDDGTVLVVGGNALNQCCGGTDLASAVIFQPDAAGGTWLPVDDMASGRWRPAVMPLGASVVVAGGGVSVPAAQLYDVGAGTWSDHPATLDNRRALHGSVVTAQQTLMLFGGSDSDGVFESEELNDGAWHTLLAVPDAFVGFSETKAVALSEASVLVVGTSTRFLPPGSTEEPPQSTAHVYTYLVE